MESRNGSKGNILKVVELNLQNRVYDAMKKPGFAVEELTRQLGNEGIDITAQSIRKFIRKTKDAQKELIKQDMKVSGEIMKLAMDYSKELKDILKEVQQVKNEAKENKDFVTYNQLVGKLLQGIELIAKLTGDVKPKANINYDIKVIYNEINNDIEKQMSGLTSDKIIDIDYEIAEDDKKEYERLSEAK
jgi:gas vesicle protein